MTTKPKCLVEVIRFHAKTSGHIDRVPKLHFVLVGCLKKKPILNEASRHLSLTTLHENARVRSFPYTMYDRARGSAPDSNADPNKWNSKSCVSEIDTTMRALAKSLWNGLGSLIY